MSWCVQHSHAVHDGMCKIVMSTCHIHTAQCMHHVQTVEQGIQYSCGFCPRQVINAGMADSGSVLEGAHLLR